MLSSQADELRKAALVQGAHARYDVASLLTDAADTILSLRDRAQELQQELTMREESEQEKVIKYLREENIDWEDRYRALAAETARLQEVVADGEMHAREILAENAKLREDNACLVKAIEELHSVKLEDRLVALENENDRLRELVRDMWPHVRHRSRMCKRCDLPCDESDECLLYKPMRRRMRELGIEVGE